MGVDLELYRVLEAAAGGKVGCSRRRLMSLESCVSCDDGGVYQVFVAVAVAGGMVGGSRQRRKPEEMRVLIGGGCCRLHGWLQ